jgi:hypothetical protein
MDGFNFQVDAGNNFLHKLSPTHNKKSIFKTRYYYNLPQSKKAMNLFENEKYGSSKVFG